MRIVLTGAGGFIGWHVRCLLSTLPQFQVTSLDRREFEDDDTLSAAVADCGAVIHLAGVNRGEAGSIAKANEDISWRLVRALEKANVAPAVIFSSSTHIYRGTEYGQSKINAAGVLEAWADKSGARFVNLVIPNVFGELCRPHYNSVVATFCHELLNGRRPNIIQDNEYEYIHVLDVSRRIVESLTNSQSGLAALKGMPLKVSRILAMLEGMHEAYQNNVTPSFGSEFDLRLFNTYRSYTGAERGRALTPRTDERGSLFEVFRTIHGGQLFYSTTKPGVIRGNHFHFTKYERFIVVSGRAVIRFRRVCGDEVTSVTVDGANPMCVDIPTLHTHNIENIGDSDLYTLFWTNAFYDPQSPDTYFDKV